MTTTKPSLAFRLVVTILMIINLWSLSSWAIAYFMHYHGQRQVLRPADYDATVVPAAGADVAPGKDFRRSEDGGYFVLVATLGTAPYIDRTTSDLLPVFLLSAVGLVIALWAQRKGILGGAEPAAATAGSRD